MSNFLYNPDRKGKDVLVAEFVIRTELYDEIMKDLESSAMKYPEQHYLLVGQRGAGKTTLLHRIKYGIEDSKKLHSWVIPVLFAEEQYNVSELANLWENVGQYLEDYHGFDGLYKEMEAELAKNDFEEKCLDILEKRLAAKKKKVVLLIDNIGDLLHKIGDLEVRRMREILQTKNFIRVIAGSPFYLESILDYRQPFFEFFKVMRLDGLNRLETEKLLLKLGEVHGETQKITTLIRDTPQRIEAMRIITGGVPRTMALLFRIFIDNEHSNSIKDLEKVLDVVTPLYKHRMDDLPRQQQRIVDAVARKWDAISVKELKEKVRLESKVISAQLRQLEKNQIVEKRTTDTKNHLYILKERFWNIWFLMRYGRKDDKERVIWLIRFLESWCDNDDITKRIEALISKTKEGKMSAEEADMFGSVYASLSQLSLNQKLMLKEADSVYISKKVSLSDEELFEAAKKMLEKKDYERMAGYLCEIKNLGVNHKKFLILASVGEDPDSYNKRISSAIQLKFEAEELSPSTVQLSVIIFLLRLVFWGVTKKQYEEKLTNFFVSVINFLLTDQADRAEQSDLSMEVELLIINFKYLLTNGLIETAKKIVNHSHSEDEKISLVFRDVFKPLYYAVEYFDKPAEIERLPSEVADPAREIRKRFLEKRS